MVMVLVVRSRQPNEPSIKPATIKHLDSRACSLSSYFVLVSCSINELVHNVLSGRNTYTILTRNRSCRYNCSNYRQKPINEITKQHNICIIISIIVTCNIERLRNLHRMFQGLVKKQEANPKPSRCRIM